MRDTSKRYKITIGCCCYNEEGNVENTYKSFIDVINKLPQYDFEIIFEDNCSTDKTKELLREIAEKDKRVKVIFNKANFGVENSGTNLLMNITGDIYIGCPCDLQEPIEMLPDFMQYWEEGYDIVWGQKTKSKENPVKYACRNIYYNVIDMFSDYDQLHQTTGFGITDRTVIDAFMVSRRQDSSVNLRQWVVEYGFKIKLIPYTQRKRTWGKSSYTMASYYDFAITSLCTTSIKPLRFMTFIGMGSSFVCAIIAFFYLIYKLTHWYTFDAGMAPLIIGLFFVMGVQLFCIGILGEYIGIVLKKVTNKPIVIEEERLNFDDNDD